MQKLLEQRSAWVCAVACLLMPFMNTTWSQSLDDTVKAEQAIDESAAQSQVRVSELADQAQQLLSEYRTIVRETESLKIYNDNLETVVGDQRREIESVNQQLAGLEETNRDVVPLMLEMVAMLERIVEADVPFRLRERRARVQRLNDIMGQADVTVSEKYRRIIEAYRGELEYGRTTEAYADSLPTSGQTVNFLRVGRVLLVYQTSDQAVTGWFNPVTREFEDLEDGRFRLEVERGLAISRNQKAPNLVMLPVPGPELVE